MIRVASLWRHPIKSHGREEVQSVTLAPGQTMPWDRHWAVTHDKSKFDASSPGWIGCRNFVIGTVLPSVAGIWAHLDEAAMRITLRHADLEDLTFAPDDPGDQERFLRWLAPLMGDTSLVPTALVSAGERGMTDSDYPSVSLMNLASHRAVEGRLGRPLEIERWRSNIWLDGPRLWEEFDWIGRTIQLGEARLELREPIARCKHTTANPRTGQRDTDTLGLLENGWGHTDFGVYAVVTQGGVVAVGDAGFLV